MLCCIPNNYHISCPLPDGMILINTFEEPFGDEFGKGVWTELSGTASSSIQGNIVALASFNGEIRFSACTGFFIEWNGCSTVLTSTSLVRKSGYENMINKNLRAGIGGPLLDFDGRFIGMNFYGRDQGTPYLHWSVILCGLEHFKIEGSVAKVDNAGKPSHLLGWTMAEDRSVRLNSWHVPKPYWCHPDDPKIHTEPIII
nr:unnamed protein product [Digitaria exilis]